MNKSTDINNLPNINNLTESAGDEDNTIHEVLAEIQNENEAQLNGGPPVPIDAVQQMPPQPMNNISQPMNQNQQLQQMQQMQQLQQMQQIQKQQMQPQPMEMNNINYLSQPQVPSKLNIILDEINKNMKLFIVVIVSYILLQNPQFQNLITSRLANINVPYINIIALAVTQVVIILGSKLLL